MHNFTSFSKITEINEAAKRMSINSLTKAEITEYLQSVKKKIPKQVADIVYLTAKYNICTQQDIDNIRNASKSQLDKLAFKHGISIDEMEDLWRNLKELKSNLRLLPQYQTPSERLAFMNGKLVMSDINIDLDTSAGRNAVAKQYMGLITKIVNSYIGKSKLGKPELMSAAMQGFVDAMNNWRRDQDSAVPFKTYAGYRVKQQILNDINTHSYSMKTNWYAVSKEGNKLNGISLDSFGFDTDDDFKQDRLAQLGVEDPNYNLTKNEEEQWKDLYKIIENTFKKRDIDVFYRYFGLNGNNREKGKDIAKSLGIAPSTIRPIINGILTALKKNSKAMDLLMSLQTTYNESLMLDLMGLDKEMMIEAILSDDTFILLEELTKWSNKEVYNNSIFGALESLSDSEAKAIKEILSKDFEYLDKVFKSNKKTIIKFLNLMYPTENFSRKTDVTLLEYMDELTVLYKQYV